MQTQRDAAMLAENQNAARNQIGQVMQMTTVGPGQAFSGVAQYDIPKAVRKSKQPIPIVLEVRTGDETHIFRGTLSKRKIKIVRDYQTTDVVKNVGVSLLTVD